MPADFENTWRTFLGEVRAARSGLFTTLRSIVSDQAAITDAVSTRFIRSSIDRPERGRVESFQKIFEEHAAHVLLDPIRGRDPREIAERLSRAFEDARHRAADAARRLPGRSEFSPADVLSTFDSEEALSPVLRLYRWTNRRRTVAVRAAVIDALDNERWRQRHAEGAIHMALLAELQALAEPWKHVRNWLLGQLREDEFNESILDRARESWKSGMAARTASVDRAMKKVEEILARQDMRLSESLIAEPITFGMAGRSHAKQRRWQETVGYWARQGRAVATSIEAELAVISLGKAAAGIARGTVESLGRERQDVVEELNEAIRTLQDWSGEGEDPLPTPRAHLLPARERVGKWVTGMTGQARAHLPESVELGDPRRPLPGWRPPWRIVQPQAEFLDALDTARESVGEALVPLESDHRALVAEIERAREVVRFSLRVRDEESATTRTSDPAVVTESVSNARALLEHQRDNLQSRLPGAEAGILSATATAFHRYIVAFEEGRINLWSYLAREGIARGTRRLIRETTNTGVRGGRQAMRLFARTYHRILVAIGWEVPLESGLAPVERRRFWDDRSAVDIRAHQLPLIYERLFRPEPVEDPRFLVGREPEMAALNEARNLWKAGRRASVLIVGQRGSGKTSLLNCSILRVFGNDTVVRSSFRDRMASAGELRRFLAGLLGTTPDNLLSTLTEEPRVVILEEVSRTFLRVIGGLDPLNELMRIVSVTSERTLWILSISAEGYRFLEASSGISRAFSHRINASSVEPEQLRQAILERHHLSGLRLEFAPPPSSGRVAGWFRRISGISDSPEEVFFGALYRQSGGIYRSAFYLWRHQMDRVEGGVLYMRNPLPLSFEEVVRGMGHDDVFTLQMILQHGSLSPSEHARVFGRGENESQAILERLASRGLLEPDPAGPGLRIRPSVNMLVRSALNSKNLI